MMTDRDHAELLKWAKKIDRPTVPWHILTIPAAMLVAWLVRC